MSAVFTDLQSITQKMKDWATEFEPSFTALLSPHADVHPKLVQAVHYSALDGGKRLRPYLTVRCCELAGGRRDVAVPAAAAVECVHVFSLIHDDLPAMDNDDFRRGRPSNHRQFDEATAILAGDALLTLAFELLCIDSYTANCSVKLVRELSRSTGWGGMIGGQLADIAGERHPASRSSVEQIHAQKTAALIEAACRMGAVTAGAADIVVNTLGRYGRHLGQAFQIADDLLDVTSCDQQLGKKAGKDAAAGKQTMHQAVGIEEARSIAEQQVRAAIDALASFGDVADDLRSLARFVVERRH